MTLCALACLLTPSARAAAPIKPADFLPSAVLYLHHVPSSPKLRAWLTNGGLSPSKDEQNSHWVEHAVPGEFGSPIPEEKIANFIYQELANPLGEDQFLALFPGKAGTFEFLTGGRSPAANTLIFKLQDQLKALVPEIQWTESKQSGVTVKSGELGEGTTIRIASINGWLLAGTAPKSFANALLRISGNRSPKGFSALSQTPLWKAAMTAQWESADAWLTLSYLNFDAFRRDIPADGTYSKWVQFFKSDMKSSAGAVVTEYADGPERQASRVIFLDLDTASGRALKGAVQPLGEAISRWAGHETLLSFSAGIQPANLFRLPITQNRPLAGQSKYWTRLLAASKMSVPFEAHALVEQGSLPGARHTGWLITPFRGGVQRIQKWFQSQSDSAQEESPALDPKVTIAAADSGAEFQLTWKSGRALFVAFTQEAMILTSTSESMAFFYDRLLGSAKPGLPKLVGDTWAFRTAPNAFLDLLVDRHLLDVGAAAPIQSEVPLSSIKPVQPARLSAGLTPSNDLLVVQSVQTGEKGGYDNLPKSWLAGGPEGLQHALGALDWWRDLLKQSDENSQNLSILDAAGISGLFSPQRPGTEIEIPGPALEWLSWVILALGTEHPVKIQDKAPAIIPSEPSSFGNLESEVPVLGTSDPASAAGLLENPEAEAPEPQVSAPARTGAGE